METSFKLSQVIKPTPNYIQVLKGEHIPYHTIRAIHEMYDMIDKQGSQSKSSGGVHVASGLERLNALISALENTPHKLCEMEKRAARFALATHDIGKYISTANHEKSSSTFVEEILIDHLSWPTKYKELALDAIRTHSDLSSDNVIAALVTFADTFDSQTSGRMWQHTQKQIVDAQGNPLEPRPLTFVTGTNFDYNKKHEYLTVTETVQNDEYTENLINKSFTRTNQETGKESILLGSRGQALQSLSANLGLPIDWNIGSKTIIDNRAIAAKKDLDDAIMAEAQGLLDEFHDQVPKRSKICRPIWDFSPKFIRLSFPSLEPSH